MKGAWEAYKVNIENTLYHHQKFSYVYIQNWYLDFSLH